jgi:hypothetical protein
MRLISSSQMDTLSLRSTKYSLPQQQALGERATMLRHTYNDYCFRERPQRAGRSSFQQLMIMLGSALPEESNLTSDIAFRRYWIPQPTRP